MDNEFYQCKLILESRGKQSAKFHLQPLETDFDTMMSEYDSWCNEVNAPPVINYFINGDFCPGSVKGSINNVTVIGDINSTVVGNSEKIVHITPVSVDAVLKNVLTREAQRGSWRSIDNSLKGRNFNEYQKSIVLLRTYSHILKLFEKADENTFNAICRKILEYVTSLYNNKEKEK